MYIEPQILSFSYHNIIEAFGPVQNQYGYVDIGGGVYEAMLNRQAIEYRIELASSKIKHPQAGIEIANKITV